MQSDLNRGRTNDLENNKTYVFTLLSCVAPRFPKKYVPLCNELRHDLTFPIY